MQTIANKYYHTLSAYGIDKAIAQGTMWYPDAWQYCLDVSKEYPVTPERVQLRIDHSPPVSRHARHCAKDTIPRASGVQILGLLQYIFSDA